MTAATIMVVDDNASTRRMVKNALSRAGYNVVEASDGAGARRLMAAEKPRLVLQDLVLPDVDGFSLVGELRGIGGSDVSILAFSGFVNKLDEARISAVGFDHIIPKPIAPSALVPIVEAHLPLASSSTERFGAGRRIVIADDDPMQLKLASFRLGRLGFETETVSDGAAALAAIRRQRPDAVVSDVMMPELDGFGLAMALRQDPELASLPLVLVTSSYVEPSDRELAKRAGANELVVRTPELTELIELLRSTLTTGGRTAAIDNTVVEELERERNRRVFRQLERQVMLNTGLAKRCSALASELTVLTGMADTILKHRDIDVSLDDALAACFDAGGVSVGALYQLDNGVLRVRTLGDPAAQLPHAEAETFFGRLPLLNDVMHKAEPLYVGRDGADEVGKELLASMSATGLLMVPLTSPSGPIGALLMVARNRDLDEQDWRSFATGVAAQLSQVLTLARAYANAEAAERKAAAHAALLEAVVESAPDFVLHLDREGRIRFINRAAPPLNARDLLGTEWFMHVVPDQRANARLAFETALAGMTAEFETSVAGTGGAPPQFYSCRLGPVREDGKITGAVIVARDVTDKKQTEMQLMLADRMASVGTLAAGVAHEINNPLAAVIANLDMAIQDVGDLASTVTLPVDLVDELQDARLSADRVREIVRDLKLFSRTHEEQFGAVNVEKVIDSTLRMAHNEIRHRAKLIKTYGGVPRVVANESRLGQVLLNLIVNAVQAIPEGNYEKNEIRVSTYVNGNGNNNVVISIRDTGGGMTPEVKQRLFTPFFTTKPIGVGTGLGLAISHRIINAMGGTIAFESELGKGTEFRILLPIAGSHIQPITQKLPTLAAAVRRGRVLVIDDEETLGQAIRRYLAQDHDVEAVTSGRAALEIFAGGSRFDVILCDLMMPQMTGMELHATLLKLDPVQAERMVFVTGGAFTETARSFFEDTNNPRIEKPFDLKTLRHLINELIR